MNLRFRFLSALLLACAVLAAPSLARAQMPANAFAVDARLGGGVVVGGLGNVVALPSLTIGGRVIDRLQIGLGFGLFRYSTPGGGGGTNYTTVDFVPTIAIDLLKARDNKVAWYFKGGLPLGTELLSGPNRSFFVIGYDAALGARYCPHPNFAFGLEGGVTGIFVDPAGNNGSGLTTIYGALVGTFYWGH